MSTPRSVVVVGGGLAAANAVAELREGGYDGPLTVVGQEHERPYERPPLSKGYLAGTDVRDSVFAHPAGWYAEHDVELVLGVPVTDVDLAARTVATAERTLPYEALLLATGARSRRLPSAPESDVVGYLRTLADSDRVRAALRPGRRVAIIGGGWIGLEVAAAARGAGCEVVVLEAAERPLQRVLGPEVADVFAALHTSHGVDLWTGISVATVKESAGRATIKVADGTSVTADFVLVGVGAVPNTALAETAGLTVDGGVVVDEYLRSSHPDVLAAGDVAKAYHPRLGRHVRVEHWDNAIGQGRAAARTLLGTGTPYDRLPYFFTDQYDLGMEYVGDATGYDDVVLRGDVAGRVFTAFWLRRGAVVAGMHVNDWDAIDAVRQIVAAGDVDVRALRDPDVPLAELAG